jgi:hypothetical protein
MAGKEANKMKKLASLYFLIFFLTVISFTVTASADTYTTVDLGTLYNDTFPKYIGATPPTTLSGIPFYFGADGQSYHANGWDWKGGWASNVSQISLSTNISAANTVYLLLNTVWGAYDAGSVKFTGSGGETYTISLISGANIRDWHDGPYYNSLTDPNAQNVSSYYPDHWGGNSRIDMLTVDLPVSFHNDILTSIIFTDYGVVNNTSSRLLIEGITVSSVPLPSAVWLLGSGLVGLTGLRRFRKS